MPEEVSGRTPEARPIRIAFFAGTMRPGHDGVTRVLYRLIDDLESRPVDYLFFSPIVPDEQGAGGRFREVPSFRFPLYKDYRLAFPGDHHFDSALTEFKPDILHINSPCSLGFAAVRYGRRAGIPVVATYHTHFPSYAKYYKMPALEPFGWNYLRRLYGGCSRIFVPSRPILEELAAHHIENLVCLPHGVDTKTFHPRYRSEEWRSRHGLQGKHVLLFVGRLVWEKDLATLAQTWQLLSALRNDVAMVVVGDGPIRADLERYMPGAVFPGKLSGEQLSTAYASSDIFVFPSTTETFGNVTIEAMASGVVPICVTEGGAYGSVEDGVTGLHAAPRNPVDLLGKVETLLADQRLRRTMAEAALRYAQSQSWVTIFDQLMVHYHEVVQMPPATRKPKRHRKAA